MYVTCDYHPSETRLRLRQRRAKLQRGVVGENEAAHLAERAEDLPILLRLTVRRDGGD